MSDYTIESPVTLHSNGTSYITAIFAGKDRYHVSMWASIDWNDPICNIAFQINGKSNFNDVTYFSCQIPVETLYPFTLGEPVISRFLNCDLSVVDCLEIVETLVTPDFAHHVIERDNQRWINMFSHDVQKAEDTLKGLRKQQENILNIQSQLES